MPAPNVSLASTGRTDELADPDARPAARGRSRRAFGFAAVGASGLVVNSMAFVGLVALGVHYIAATILATQVSTAWNFVLAERLVFDGRGRAGAARRYRIFWATNTVALVARGPFVVMLTELGTPPVVSNLVTLLALFVARFTLADRLVWGASRESTLTVSAAERPGVAARVGALLPRDRTGQLHLVAVATVAMLAVAARCIALGAVGFNSDEAVYAGQGATMLGLDRFADNFSLFRAHPLLLQGVVGLTFRVAGVDDTLARGVVALVFGCGSVAFGYLLGRRLHGRNAGLFVAAVLAVLPYHVIVSRQVMVDTPMGFFIGLGMWLLARAITGASERNIVGAFVAFGAAALSKEVAVIAIAPAVVTLWWTFGHRVLRHRALLLGMGAFALVFAPFPLSRLINQSKNASSFVLWQLSRSPNHPYDYFLRVFLQYGGPILAFLVAVGLVRMGRRRLPGDVLVLSWSTVMIVFFTVWPTKLFAYLFPVLPALAVAAWVGVEWLTERVSTDVVRRTVLRNLTGGLVTVMLTVMTTNTVLHQTAARLPGAGDFDIEIQSFAGGREVGEWATRTPANAKFLTIGPSIGNIVRFYGDRESVALSVNLDPAKRNPAYVPVANPDLAIRNMDVHYAIWDAYSADRSAFYSQRLISYAEKYGGHIVFSVSVDDDGRLVTKDGPPLEGADVRMLVYDLQGGNPSGIAPTEAGR